MTSSQICVFDVTLPASVGSVSVVKTSLKELAKAWTFQLEQGSETGYLHYQIRLSLFKKRRQGEAIKLFRTSSLIWDCLSPMNFRPTVTGNCTTMSYVMKADTRVEGPWTDKDPEELYVPRQCRDVVLYPWQQAVVQTFDVWDSRHINVIVNKTGNIGKSVLKTYCGVRGMARAIPPFENHKDLMAMVFDMKPKQSGAVYLIDIPRAINQTGMRGLWSGIESLKDGYCYDMRYKFRECYFDCPTIWCFMNDMPETKWLSADRWKFFNVVDNKLCPRVRKRARSPESEYVAAGAAAK